MAAPLVRRRRRPSGSPTQRNGAPEQLSITRMQYHTEASEVSRCASHLPGRRPDSCVAVGWFCLALGRLFLSTLRIPDTSARLPEEDCSCYGLGALLTSRFDTPGRCLIGTSGRTVANQWGLAGKPIQSHHTSHHTNSLNAAAAAAFCCEQSSAALQLCSSGVGVGAGIGVGAGAGALAKAPDAWMSGREGHAQRLKRCASQPRASGHSLSMVFGWVLSFVGKSRDSRSA
eukprot:scaffold7375_cov268-Pinguiococcus_pyrenoidosus.AAC.42